MTDPGLKLFVNRLPLNWSESTIFEYFQSYGKVSSVELFKEKFVSTNHTGLGCAYVKFLLRSEAEETMASLNHSQVKYGLFRQK